MSLLTELGNSFGVGYKYVAPTALISRLFQVLRRSRNRADIYLFLLVAPAGLEWTTCSVVMFGSGLNSPECHSVQVWAHGKFWSVRNWSRPLPPHPSPLPRERGKPYHTFSNRYIFHVIPLKARGFALNLTLVTLSQPAQGIITFRKLSLEEMAIYIGEIGRRRLVNSLKSCVLCKILHVLLKEFNQPFCACG